MVTCTFIGKINCFQFFLTLVSDPNVIRRRTDDFGTSVFMDLVWDLEISCILFRTSEFGHLFWDLGILTSRWRGRKLCISLWELGVCWSLLGPQKIGISFETSEFGHIFWDLGIWAYLLGPLNLDISFGTLNFVYLVWGSRKPTDGGRRSKRAERSVKAMALAQSLWLQCSNPWVSVSSLSIITFFTSF